jgi:regulatory protein
LATKPPRKSRQRAPATVLQRAIRLLARREMSRAELEARLMPRQGASGEEGLPPVDVPLPEAESDVEVAATLDRLTAAGLQSDGRFAENYVRGRQARNGSRRLAAELRQRGVDSDTIGAVLETVVASDLERARELWTRRFQAPQDPRERARQVRFLAARGFDMAVIRAVVGGSAVDDDLPGSD